MSQLVQLEIVTGTAPAGDTGAEVASTSSAVEASDVLILGCFEDEEPGTGPLAPELVRAVERAAGRKGFVGREKQAVEGSVAEGAAPVVAVHGLGKRSELDVRRLSAWVERVLEGLRLNGVERAVWVLPEHWTTRGRAAGERVCRQLALGAYRFDHYREEPEAGPVRLSKITVVPPSESGEDYRRGVAAARAVAEGVELTRDLANSPANVADPAWMEEQARDLAEDLGLDVTVFDDGELAARGMGGLLAVGQGSSCPPRLVRLAHGTEGPVVALVGKGVTFDTGGISIKPAARLDEMKYDKSGACTVLGIARAVARLDLPIRLRVYVPLAENMPDGAAYRPGDIIRCYNGKTVEIMNTDAEGRLILADAMSLAVEEGCDALVELSTLTGACVVALGHHGAGLFTPDDGLADALLASAADGGERLWRLPLWDEFADDMKGTHADLRNSGPRWGGAATAAAFLSQFVGDLETWAHVDIAGTAQIPKEANGSRGATGYGVALAVNWLRRLAAGA